MTARIFCAAAMGALLMAGGAQAQQPMGSIAPGASSGTESTMRLGSGDTRALQRALSGAGFDAGPADGVYGMRTREAVMAWQRQNNMQATGEPSAQMMSSLGVQRTSSATQPRSTRRATSERDRAYMGGGNVQQTPGGGMVDAAGHQMGGSGRGGGEGPGSNNMQPATSTQLQGGRSAMRDSAGRPLSSDSAGGGQGAGSNNERVGGGTRVQGTTGTTMRDAAGHTLGGNSAGGGQGAGSNNERSGAQTQR